MSKKDIYTAADKRMQKELHKDNRRRMRESFRQRSLQLNMMLALFAVSFVTLNYEIYVTPHVLWRDTLAILIKIIINFSLLNILLLGMERTRKKYDRMLIAIVVCYALGDISGFYIIGLTAIIYAIGHILFITLLLKYTYISKGQRILFGVLMASGLTISVVLMVNAFLDIKLLIFLLIYQLILITFLTLSVSNPFYLPGAIVFVLSDITGLLRIEFLNNAWTFFVTMLIYYLSVLLITISAFNETKKQVVTLSEFKIMISIFQKYDVPFWIGGTWNAAMHNNFGFSQIRDTCFICDRKGIAQLQKALHKMGFLQEGMECTESAIFYSEEWGTSKILLMDREENGIFIERIGGGRIEIDNDYFGERKIGKVSVPYFSLGE